MNHRQNVLSHHARVRLELPRLQFAFVASFVLASFVVALLLFAMPGKTALAETDVLNALDFPQPTNLAGSSVEDDEHDVDLYPAIAYDPLTERYLMVWMSLRNASSSGAGFDLYGIFLDRFGQPLTAEFLITDDDYAARSSRPSLAVNEQGLFMVVWTARGSSCRIMAQAVSGTSQVADQVIALAGSGHLHSAEIVYNPTRQRFALAYVAGDDYLPPTLFGADVVDCGNNANGVSQLRVAELASSGSTLIGEFPLTVSQGQASALRPSFAYNTITNQYLVAWEDRRNATGYPLWFDVYAQRLDAELAALGSNFALGIGADYANANSGVPWTPRPTLAAGENGFLVAWFERQTSADSTLWNVMGSMVAPNGTTYATQVVNQMTFVSLDADNPPTGFLDSAYNSIADEYLVAVSSHAQSIYGYYASARVQRIDLNGALLTINGQSQEQANMGALVDYSVDDQVTLALSSGYGANRQPGFMLVFGHHVPERHSQDYNIWGNALGYTDLTPTPPVLLAPAPWSSSNAELPLLQWQTSAQATVYEVLLDNDRNFQSPEWMGPTNEPSYQGTMALPPGVYYWRVRGQSASGLWGLWSEPSPLIISDQTMLMLPLVHGQFLVR